MQESRKPTLHTAARALVDHVDLLKRQIRHNVTPTIGDTEELFQLAETVDLELRHHEPLEPCSIGGCNRLAATRLRERPYCTRCARALSAVTRQVELDAPAIARAKLEGMVAGRAPWPDAIGAADAAHTCPTCRNEGLPDQCPTCNRRYQEARA